MAHNSLSFESCEHIVVVMSYMCIEEIGVHNKIFLEEMDLSGIG
jgi:hypothetical protein